MPVYEYKGFGGAGKSVKGVLTADTPEEARQRLREQKVHVKTIKVTKKRSSRFFKFGARSEMAVISRQLSTLLGSGTNLSAALQVVLKQVDDDGLRSALMEIHENLSRGHSFGTALEEYPQYFSNLYISMVKAGESSGNLAGILSRLSDYLQYRKKVVGGLVAAMTYPVIVMLAGTALVTFLMAGPFPEFIRIMLAGTRGIVMPMPTRILMGVSNLISGYWWLLIILAGLGLFALYRIIITDKGRYIVDRISLRVPILGSMLEKSAVSRFSMTLATLLESGIPPMDALLIVQQVLNNRYMGRAISQIRKGIIDGNDMSSELSKTGVFPPIVGHMIAIGEESGELESLLREIADAYDVEVELATEKMMAILGPIMILGMAGIILFVALAVVLPIQEIGNIH